MANRADSWNAVTINLVGQAADITVTEANGGVKKDANGGATVHNT